MQCRLLFIHAKSLMSFQRVAFQMYMNFFFIPSICQHFDDSLSKKILAAHKSNLRPCLIIFLPPSPCSKEIDSSYLYDMLKREVNNRGPSSNQSQDLPRLFTATSFSARDFQRVIRPLGVHKKSRSCFIRTYCRTTCGIPGDKKGR